MLLSLIKMENELVLGKSYSDSWIWMNLWNDSKNLNLGWKGSWISKIHIYSKIQEPRTILASRKIHESQKIPIQGGHWNQYFKFLVFPGFSRIFLGFPGSLYFVCRSSILHFQIIISKSVFKNLDLEHLSKLRPAGR